MRIALISEAPTSFSGFGRTANVLGRALLEIGHTPFVFGIGAAGFLASSDFQEIGIWAGGDLESDHFSAFPYFFNQVRPDAILINYDLISALRWLSFVRKAGIPCPIVVHLLLDGLPIHEGLLSPLKSAAAIISPTKAAFDFLRTRVAVPNYLLPHLVDTKDFFPRSAVREQRGGSPKIIGVFAQNRRRKQIPLIINAVKILASSGMDVNLMIRTDRQQATRLGGDNLNEVVRHFEIESRVTITSHSDFPKQTKNTGMPRWYDLIPQSLPEMICFCDCTIVASTCGAFEYNIIESQACGVPVLVTDDQAAMSEVAAEPFLNLTPSFYDLTDYGAKAYRILPATIADTIAQLFSKPELYAGMRDRGLANIVRFTLDIQFDRVKELLTRIFK